MAAASQAVPGEFDSRHLLQKNDKFLSKFVVFYSSRRLGMKSRVRVYAITAGAFFCGLIPYDCYAINSIPQQVATSMHGFAVIENASKGSNLSVKKQKYLFIAYRQKSTSFNKRLVDFTYYLFTLHFSLITAFRFLKVISNSE